MVPSIKMNDINIHNLHRMPSSNSKTTLAYIQNQFHLSSSTLSHSKPLKPIQQNQLHQSNSTLEHISNHISHPFASSKKQRRQKYPNLEMQEQETETQIKKSRTNLIKCKNSNNNINQAKNHIHAHQDPWKARPFSQFKHPSLSLSLSQ